MKYSKEFKLDCVLKRKAGKYIDGPPGTSHNNFLGQVRKWNKIYDSLGEAGLENYKPTLDINERLELINRIENGESYNSVALSAGIQAEQLIRLHKIYMEKGIDGLKSLKRGRPSMSNKKTKETKPLEEMSDKEKVKYYKEQLEYLEAENAYLKKLKALVQSKQNTK